MIMYSNGNFIFRERLPFVPFYLQNASPCPMPLWPTNRLMDLGQPFYLQSAEARARVSKATRTASYGPCYVGTPLLPTATPFCKYEDLLGITSRDPKGIIFDQFSHN
ncbi:hypothetical protein AVEN_231850-1 [Araneus ventricosus]|uniref:Uncharacterized protein n=1 Tax=Araneus ventricosus TaxID=182803 RepID=A0A4Y2J1C8_ARAVE|nr:hypothetical protein AVEN_231850-1 [Araneus ventricosus]